MAEPVNLLDLNVLLALFDPRHVHHGAAHTWFADVGRFATTPLTETGFVRLVMNPQVGGETAATALTALAQVRDLPGWSFLADDASPVRSPLGAAPAGYRQVTDFHLVGLAVAHRHRFATFDAKVPRALAPGDRQAVVVVPV